MPIDSDEYELQILTKHYQIFGPFPDSYEEIADKQRLRILVYITQSTPPETLRPFHLTTAKEICEEDKRFVLGIMKLDPRDRPTAEEPLGDEWFAGVE